MQFSSKEFADETNCFWDHRIVGARQDLRRHWLATAHNVMRHFMSTPTRQIPPERQALYYGGMLLVGIGVLLILSTFIPGIANFGNFNDFAGRAQSEMARAIGGMILIIIGRI